MWRISPAVRTASIELVGYALASAVALAADTSVLALLVRQAGWHYLPASAVAFTTGALVAYLLSVRFVFRARVVRNRTLELGYFVSLGLAGLLVNSATLFVAVGAAGLGLISAKMIAAACTFATNFTLRRSLLFSPPRMECDEPQSS